MGEGETWKERLRRQLSAIPEPVPGMPLVEIAGQCRVLIENHRGVTCYGRELIRIRVNYGEVAVAGCNLQLARMSRETVVITGHIHCVSLHREVNR